MAVNKYWILAYLALGALYISTLPVLPYSFAFAVKAAPILLLLGLAWQKTVPPIRLFFVCALGFSALGDVFLALEAQWFLFGLGAFLCAHLAYQGYFWQHIHYKGVYLLPIAVMVGFCIVMLVVLQPHLGEMLIPVVVYLTVIAAMVISAILASHLSLWLVVGAVMFAISDSILAYNMFVEPFAAANYLVMISYYLAQGMLFLGAAAVCAQSQYHIKCDAAE